MIDSHNRLINYLRVSVTDRCNLRCIYCMPREGVPLIGHSDILRYEEIWRIVHAAARMGVSKVRLTGGEPLVRRGLVDFFRSLQSIEGLDEIGLTTNGTLLEREAEVLAKAGMKRINVSLDSLKADRYAAITRGGDLQSVLRGIEAVQALGLAPIKINVVVIKGLNDDEVLDFARFTLEKPFQVRFIELMPFGSAHTRCDVRYLSNDIVKERIETVYRLTALDGNGSNRDGPACLYRLADGPGSIGFISPLSHHFCSTCNRLRLTADGHLRTCLLSDDETNLKEPLRNGCNNQELYRLIRSALEHKPLHHSMFEKPDIMQPCRKEMSAIGG